MKIIFILIFNLLIFIPTTQATQLLSGTYECLEDTSGDICPQIISPKIQNGKLVEIAVIYSDYCGDQGPFRYACNSINICADLNVRFTIKNNTEYLWENLKYDFHCNFTKKLDQQRYN